MLTYVEVMVIDKVALFIGSLLYLRDYANKRSRSNITVIYQIILTQ